jgi:tetratricopeptide (TPR) repeat protein
MVKLLNEIKNRLYAKKSPFNENQLFDDLTRGKIAYFVGSAISTLPPSNLPSFGEMKDDMIELIVNKAGAQKTTGIDFSLLAPELVYNCVYSVINERFVDSHKVLNHQNGPANINKRHRLLSKLLMHETSSKILLTTNFDELIESALEQDGYRKNKDYYVYYDSDGFHSFAQRYGREESLGISILKLHGTIGKLKSLSTLFTQVALGLSHSQCEAIDAVIKDKKVLFLGYSGNDSDVFPKLISNDIETMNGFYWDIKDKNKGYNLNLLGEFFSEKVQFIEKDITGLLETLALNLNIEVGNEPQDENPQTQSDRDNLYGQWADTIQHSEAVEILAYLCLCLQKTEQAGALFEETLRLLKSTPSTDSNSIVRVLRSIGMLTKGKDHRLSYLEQALTLAKANNNATEEKRVLRDIAMVHCDYQLTSASAVTTLEKASELPIDFILLGHIYRQKGNFIVSKKNYEEAYQLIIKKDGQDSIAFANICNMLGVLYQSEDEEKALDYHEKSFNLYKKLGNIAGASLGALNIAIIYLNRRQYESAKTNFQTSFDLSSRIMDITNMATVADKYDCAARYEEAIYYYMRILKLVSMLGIRRTGSFGPVFELTGGLHWGQYDVDSFALEEAITLGNQNLILAFCANKIGEIHGNMENLIEAGKWFSDAHNFIRVASLPSNVGTDLKREIERNVDVLNRFLC